jgi:hypothetical protein
VGRPNELAERAGERGDKGELAESEVKPAAKSSVPKSDTCEKSEYGGFKSVSFLMMQMVEDGLDPCLNRPLHITRNQSERFHSLRKGSQGT